MVSNPGARLIEIDVAAGSSRSGIQAPTVLGRGRYSIKMQDSWPAEPETHHSRDPLRP